MLASSCLSVRMENSAPTGRILMKFDFETFSKICLENSSLIKIRQKWRVLHMNGFSHLWQYLANFFLEWEMFRMEIVEKIKTHISRSVTFYCKSCRLWENVEKYGGAREDADNMAPARGIMIKQTPALVHPRPPGHKHTQGRTHARKRMLSPPARARTHTQTQK